MNLPQGYTCILQCERSIKKYWLENEEKDWKISNKNAVYRNFLWATKMKVLSQLNTTLHFYEYCRIHIQFYVKRCSISTFELMISIIEFESIFYLYSIHRFKIQYFASITNSL